MLYGFIKKTRKNVLCPPLSTLLQHRALWVQEPASQRYRGTLQRLSGEEWGLSLTLIRFDPPSAKKIDPSCDLN